MDKNKKLVSLISTEGKTAEEITKEALKAYKHFKETYRKTNEGKKDAGKQSQPVMKEWTEYGPLILVKGGNVHAR